MSTILDFDAKSADQHLGATVVQRFINNLLDGFALYAIGLVVNGTLMSLLGGMSQEEFTQTITDSAGDFQAIMPVIMAYFWKIILVTYLVRTIFYTCIEFFTQGKSVGKYASKTRVVSVDGSALTLNQCAIRSICRLIPFEFISVFMNNGVMWHDNFSNTRVVQEG